MTTNVLPTRLCGRCRRPFPLDDTIEQPGVAEWFACPSCAATLLPGRRSAPTTPPD